MADKNLSLGTVFTARVSKRFEAEVKRLMTITERLVAEMNNMTGAMGRASGATAALTGRLEHATTASAKLGQVAGTVNKQIGKVRGAWERFTAALKVTVAYGVAATMIYRLVGAIGAGVQEIIDFDQALRNLQAITNATSVQIDAMGEAIKDVARVTKFSSGEVAGGMVLLAQAGFTATEATQAIDATAKLATGTLSSMAFTADLLTTTIRAFNLQAVEATRVADVMANAINRSKLTIEKLRIAFNFVGAAAAQTGLSLEETAASMMVLANNGLRASTIGTGLRQVLSRLLAPNKKLREQFEAFGISLDQVNPRLVGFQKALRNIAPLIYDNKKKVVDMGKAYSLFGLRGAQAAAVLVKGFLSGDYEEMLDKVYEFGSSTRMAEEQAKGLGVILKNLADRAKLFGIAMGEAGVTGILRGFLKTLQALATAMEWFVTSTVGKALTQLALLLGVLHALRWAIVALIVRWKAVLLLFTDTAAAINPVILMFAALSVALSTYFGRSEQARKETEKLSISLSEITGNLELYSGILDQLKKRQEKGDDVSKEYLSTLNYLIDAVPELKDEIVKSTEAWEKNAKAIKNALGTKYRDMILTSTKLIEDYGGKTQRFLRGTMSYTELLKTGLESIFKFIPDLIHELRRTFGEFLMIIGDGLMGLAKHVPVLGEAIWEFGWYLKRAGEESDKSLKSTGMHITALSDNIKKLRNDTELQTEEMKKFAYASMQIGRSQETIISSLRELGATSEQIKIITAYLEKLKKVLDEVGGSGKKTTEALKKAALDIERRYLALMLSMEKDARIKAKANYDKRLADIKKWEYDRINQLRNTKKKEEAIEQAGKEAGRARIKALEEYNREILNIEKKRLDAQLEATQASELAIQQEKIKAAVGNKKLMAEAQKEERQLQIEHQKQKLANEIWYYDSLVKISSGAITKESQKWYERALVGREDLTKRIREENEKTLESIKSGINLEKNYEVLLSNIVKLKEWGVNLTEKEQKLYDNKVLLDRKALEEGIRQENERVLIAIEKGTDVEKDREILLKNITALKRAGVDLTEKEQKWYDNSALKERENLARKIRQENEQALDAIVRNVNVEENINRVLENTNTLKEIGIGLTRKDLSERETLRKKIGEEIEKASIAIKKGLDVEKNTGIVLRNIVRLKEAGFKLTGEEQKLYDSSPLEVREILIKRIRKENEDAFKALEKGINIEKNLETILKNRIKLQKLGVDPNVVKQQKVIADQRKKIAEEGTKDAIKYEKDLTKITKEELKKRLAGVQLYSKEWLSVIEEMYRRDLIKADEYMTQLRKYYKYWMDELYKQWKRGEIGPEEYRKAVKKAFDQVAITLDEYRDRMAALGTVWDAIRYGIYRAAEGVRNINEVMIELFKEFPEQFSSNLTSGLWDFIDGTKEAGKAFEDFAKSTIRWIGEMITRQLLYNSIVKILPGIFGTATSTPTAVPYRIGAEYHKGGIAGVTPAPVRIINPEIFRNAKKAHSGYGLKSNEVPIIAEKGEKIYPKGMSPNVTINMINKSGTPLTAKQGGPRIDGKGMILDVVVEAMARNTRGFRDNMNSMRR